MQSADLQKKEASTTKVATSGKATTNPLQLRHPANNPLRLQAKGIAALQQKTNNSQAFSNTSGVVQRVIILDGKTYKEGEADQLRENYPEENFPGREKGILKSLEDFLPLAKKLEDVVDNENTFIVTHEYDEKLNEHFWIGDMKRATKTEKTPENSLINAAENGALIFRPAKGSSGMKISNLIQCVGIVIEAKNNKGEVVAAAGGHFVTPQSITDNAINSRGMKMINGLKDSITGHGELSAITMIALADIPDAENSGDYQAGKQAAALIRTALAIPAFHEVGESTREYKISEYGDGELY